MYVEDIDELGQLFEEGKAFAQAPGWQSAAFAPLLTGDDTIGVLSLINDAPVRSPNGRFSC